MKCKFPPALGICLLCWAMVSTMHGQVVSFVVDQFDTDTTSQYINQQWGAAVPVITWDGAQNATTSLGQNHAASGSAKWVVPWTTNGDQVEVTRAFENNTTLDLSGYTNFSFDVMYASNSATDGKGSYGALELDVIPSSDGWPSTALAIYVSATTNGNGWVHVALPFNAVGNAKLAAVTGIGIKIQQNRTGANLNGTTTFWVDNIIFSGPSVATSTNAIQIISLNSPALWQRAEFQITNVPSAANPFDPDSIRIDATFALPSGRKMLVPAFWYQNYSRSLSGGSESDTAVGLPEWRLRFTPVEVGNYSLTVVAQTNGIVCGTPVTTNFVVTNLPVPPRYGYVSVAPGKQYFQTGDGQALPLNGEDVAWASGRGTYDYDSYFASMHGAGENFARVWMCPWNLGIEDAPGTLNHYSLGSAWQLDQVLQSAEQAGIYLQLTLVYHGMFESKPDYWGGGNYWPQNPYNVTNGGPCLNQDAFFTNSVAAAIYQKRLRYLIARYGYSQNLLAWEFFNEIDNEYAYLNATDVANWHALMGNWMHTNDPYGHLMTTSLTYASSHPELWNLSQLDYTSEHAYTMTASPLNIANDAQTFLKTYHKPMMVGEFGTDWRGWNYNNGDPYLRGYREGLWSGALGGSVGTSMSWWWNNLPNYNDYGALTAVLGHTGWGRGTWTNILFGANSLVNAVGLSGAKESLIYLVAADANFPNGGTNVSLPALANATVSLINWPSGNYFVQWYDPASGSLVGSGAAIATNRTLILNLPNFAVDLAGILYTQSTLTASNANLRGLIQFQLNAGVGGVYDIERSTNLVNWGAFLTVTNAQGVCVVTDAPWTSQSAYYRARQHD